MDNTKIRLPIFIMSIGAATIFVLTIAIFYKNTSLYKKQHTPNTPLPVAVDVPLPQTPTAPITTSTAPEVKKMYTYIEVTDGCGVHFGGVCLNVRSGPAKSYPSVAKLRTGQVLKVGQVIPTETGTWYKITFDEWIRYPERLGGDWYVSADYVKVLQDPGIQIYNASTTPTQKRITIDLSDQILYAYDGDTLFMKEKMSSGIDGTPTPKGNFKIFKKTPSRYMQGPLPGISEDAYDLPGVPWTMYFTNEGAAIHGAYWHNDFGSFHSHGCINLPPDKAEELYNWADLGTKVTVRE
jgi:hypothetical protein